MHVVAESGVAAHWLYKASESNSDTSQTSGHQVVAVAAGHPDETRDASEFWDHIKSRPVPRRGLCLHAQEQDHGPAARRNRDGLCLRHPQRRGRPHCGAKINGEQRPLRTELGNGDVVEIITGDRVRAQPGLAGLRQARACPLQDPPPPQDAGARESPTSLGEKHAHPSPACRRHCQQLPARENGAHKATWDKLLRFTGNKTRAVSC